MSDKMTQLKTILAEVADLAGASQVLGWDQQTYMPHGGAEARGQQQGTLDRIAHERFTSKEVGKLLEDLKKETVNLDPDSDDARLIKVSWEQFERATKIPSAMIVERAGFDFFVL